MHEELIGYVGVDSGQLLLCDPCYIDSQWEEEDFDDESLSVMMSILRTRREPVANFLDLGCGDGILGATILGEYPSARGVLVDFSGPMLEQARNQLKVYETQLSFVNLDYGDPAWVDAMQAFGPFDAIVSGYSIHHQPDERKQEIYQEIFSLLEPGTWLINIEHVSSEAMTNIDLFEDHYVAARYAIEQRKGGTRSFEEVEQEYNNRPDKAANPQPPVPRLWHRLPGATARC